MTRIVLRAASGGPVGIGHVRRTRAVAQALIEAGDTPRLVVDDEETAAALRSQGFDAAVDPVWSAGDVAAAWLDGFRDWKSDLDALDGVRTLLVENRVGRDSAAAVLQPALHWEPDAWETEHAERVFGGAAWIPLSSEVRAETPLAREERNIDLLVTFGGIDPRGSTEAVLAALSGSDHRIVITVGAHMTERRAGIEALAANLPNAQVLDGDAALAPWMARSRAAVTAVGTTLYELAYLSVPSWILANYDEDGPALDWYRGNGPHVPLGMSGELSEAALATVLEGPPVPTRFPADLGPGADRIAAWLRHG